MIGAAIFAGMFIGALCLSPISDTFGRKPVHVIGLLLSLIGGLWVYFSPTWTSVIIAMLCKGVGMYSRLSITYLYIMELQDESRCKPVATVIMCINNSLSCLMASYLLFGGRDAKFFVLMSIVILLYALLFTPLIPESPKLLYSLKRYDDTRDSIERIAKLNGLTYVRVPFEDEVKKHVVIAENPEKVAEVAPVNCLAIFKYRQFMINILVLIFAFVFNEFSMYMLSFMLKYLPGDKYVNMFLLGVADF